MWCVAERAGDEGGVSRLAPSARDLPLPGGWPDTSAAPICAEGSCWSSYKNDPELQSGLGVPAARGLVSESQRCVSAPTRSPHAHWATGVRPSHEGRLLLPWVYLKGRDMPVITP